MQEPIKLDCVAAYLWLVNHLPNDSTNIPDEIMATIDSDTGFDLFMATQVINAYPENNTMCISFLGGDELHFPLTCANYSLYRYDNEEKLKILYSHMTLELSLIRHERGE